MYSSAPIKQAKVATKDPISFFNKNVLILSFDRDFNIVSANECFKNEIGFSDSQLSQLNFMEDFCELIPEYIKDEIGYNLKLHRSWTGNFVLPTKYGKAGWFNSNIIAIRDDEGHYIGYNMISTIGKSHQSMITEEDSTSSWMSAIFNDPEEANILIDKDSLVIDFNSTAYNFMSWYTMKELRLKENIMHYFGGSFTKSLETFMNKAKFGHRQRLCRSFTNLSGDEKTVDIELRPVSNAEGKVMGVIMVVVDITAEVNLEKRIKISEKKLDDIAFINAHEVRAPLASILGLLHLLDFESVNEEGKIILNHLKISANQLDKIIHKVSESTYLPNSNHLKND